MISPKIASVINFLRTRSRGRVACVCLSNQLQTITIHWLLRAATSGPRATTKVAISSTEDSRIRTQRPQSTLSGTHPKPTIHKELSLRSKTRAHPKPARLNRRPLEVERALPPTARPDQENSRFIRISHRTLWRAPSR